VRLLHRPRHRLPGLLPRIVVALERVALACVAGLLLCAVVVPRASGAVPCVVATGSMRPAMPPGTLVVVRPVLASEIDVGDVVTFQERAGVPDLVTHRVVGVGFDGNGEPVFQTRGDANTANDATPVHGYQLVGRRWYAVPYVGYVTGLLTGDQRRVGTALVGAGVLGYGIVLLLQAVRERRRCEEIRA
jgi:signal peptidase I